MMPNLMGPSPDDTPPDLPADVECDNLPKTLPIKNVKGDATLQSFQLPDTMDASLSPSARLGKRADENHTPAVRVATRLLSAAAIVAAPTPSKRVGRRSGRTANPTLPNGARPRLRVVRGQRINVEYTIYDGANYIGRRDDRSIDIDLEDQEPADRVWASRKHAAIHLVDNVLELEDLNSLNGTFVNRVRLAPGTKRVLVLNDVIQVGTVQLRVIA